MKQREGGKEGELKWREGRRREKQNEGSRKEEGGSEKEGMKRSMDENRREKMHTRECRVKYANIHTKVWPDSQYSLDSTHSWLLYVHL